jgi:hypothetical protein
MAFWLLVLIFENFEMRDIYMPGKLNKKKERKSEIKFKKKLKKYILFILF